MIHDITPARDNWERGYAKLQYEYVGFNKAMDRILSPTFKHIVIKDDKALVTTIDSRQDMLDAAEEDGYQQDER